MTPAATPAFVTASAPAAMLAAEQLMVESDAMVVPELPPPPV